MYLTISLFFKFGRNKTIGEINIPLKIEDFTNNQNTTGERSYDFEMYKVGINFFSYFFGIFFRIFLFLV